MMAKASATAVFVLLLLLVGLAGIFIYSGMYNVGADVPHWRVVEGMLETVRDRSIARHAPGIAVPGNLNDPKRIAAGAGLYDEMCTGCHLGPGVERSELSQGLYPAAPDLAHGDDLSPAEQFWVIKHGVKLTAMPAWGRTHSDELIWDMVAFIRRLPGMSPQQYKAILANTPRHHEEMAGEAPGGMSQPPQGPARRGAEHHH
jgi:mono/diheme cytochrome c family protein